MKIINYNYKDQKYIIYLKDNKFIIKYLINNNYNNSDEIEINYYYPYKPLILKNGKSSLEKEILLIINCISKKK